MKFPLFAIALLTAQARAWDPAGHMLVGQVAWELCSAETRRTVTELVAQLDHRFNGGQPYNFVTAGCWMDDMRALPRKEYLWSAWHYVDSAKTDDGKEFKLPAPPNVVWAIGENLKALRDPQTAAAERVKAVGMLIHWLGDIHQPLHATTWNDRGGNGYVISGVRFSDLGPGTATNLHTYWDKAFRFDGRDGAVTELWTAPKLHERPKVPGEGIVGEEARRLMVRFPREALTELAQPGDAEAWARESHMLGCTRAYPPGPHPDNTEAPKLEPEFSHAANEIAGRRVVLAGHRLAGILNGLFDPKK